MDYRKLWDGRRYYSLDACLKHTFGEKVYKITLNGGMTCPNRDGHIGTGGCIFCSAKGSGDFAGSPALSISEQLARGKAEVQKKTAGPLLHRIFPGIHKHLRTCRLPGIHLYGGCQ